MKKKRQKPKKNIVKANNTAEQTKTHWMMHLIELRSRMLRCLLALSAVFLVTVYWANNLFTLLATPLLHYMPAGQTLIATNVASPLITPLKWAFVVSLFLTIPYILYQLWHFISPGLYKQEKFFTQLILCLSIALFYCGMLFAYFVVFPLVFGFFMKVVPHGVALMPDISEYLNFTLQLLFAFGIAFQVPVVILFLLKTGICSIEQLSSCRPYVIVVAFIVGMLLTPPDVLSQVLLAVPICLLYESGIIIGKLLMKD